MISAELARMSVAITPFVRRHQEHGHVDAAGAGDHVFYKTLVTGDINDTEHGIVVQTEGRKSELDRYAAFLFFLEPVRVPAGQALDELGLAVIDVTRGAQYETCLVHSLK